MAGMKRRIKIDKETHAFHKELDEVSCPICMEHPHNAVLLQCSSHEKGCRPYICDTSYRHSNCLDRLRKLRNNSNSSSNLAPNTHSHINNSSLMTLAMRADYFEANENRNSSESNVVSSVGLTGEPVVNSTRDNAGHVEAHGNMAAGESGSFQRRIDGEMLTTETSKANLNLKCPLCRGTVLGWKVVEETRKYLNMKKRSCSRESCSFHGNYQELRRHARMAHPMSRPSDIDPSRERSWQRLEHQREYDDIVSAIHSAMPGAVVVGDYAIEEGDRLPLERETGSSQNGQWWTPIFFQMRGSANNAESRARSRALLRHRHRRLSALSEHRSLWGENLGLQRDDDNFPMPSDRDEDESPVRRRRRRLTRSRFDEYRS